MERSIAAELISDLMQAEGMDKKLNAIIAALVAILRDCCE